MIVFCDGGELGWVVGWFVEFSWVDEINPLYLVLS